MKISKTDLTHKNDRKRKRQPVFIHVLVILTRNFPITVWTQSFNINESSSVVACSDIVVDWKETVMLYNLLVIDNYDKHYWQENARWSTILREIDMNVDKACIEYDMHSGHGSEDVCTKASFGKIWTSVIDGNVDGFIKCEWWEEGTDVAILFMVISMNVVPDIRGILIKTEWLLTWTSWVIERISKHLCRIPHRMNQLTKREWFEPETDPIIQLFLEWIYVVDDSTYNQIVNE